MGDSVRTKIRKAVFHGLGQITTVNGYNLTVGDRNKREKSEEQMLNYPSVNVNFGAERYTNSETGGNSLGFLVKSLSMTLNCHVKNINDVRENEAKMLADLEKYFLNNRALPGSTGVSTVMGNLVPSENDVSGMEVNTPQGRRDFTVRIDYLQNLLDPESTSMATTMPAWDSRPPASVLSRHNAIRIALRNQLLAINVNAGYNYTVGEVNTVSRSEEQFVNYPAINLTPNPETYNDDATNMYSDVSLRKEIDYNIQVNMKNVNDILEANEKILADIEKRMMNNFTLPDANGRRTVTAAIPVSNEMFGMKVNEPLGGINVVLKCYYRQLRTDPAKLTV